MNKLTGWDDTIVAVATPPGIGALGMIRLSGSESFEIANKIFPSKDLIEQASHTLHVGLLKAGDRTLDEVVVSLFKGPHSYTGEDVVEISCHGSPVILQDVIDECIRIGARLAKAGEFTQRAFLNGKLDLAQAEAVADLIASQTQAAKNAALHTMRGGFSYELKELRERLIKFSALIELELDFSQEDVEFVDRKQLYELVDEMKEKVDQLLNSFRLGNVIKNGVSVAIIGKPNARKSTLLNTLLNENRAIVSEIPGTTRDTIEELINIDGILFRLIDTAGIREHSTDSIETAGIERSLEKMKGADLVLHVFDAGEGVAGYLMLDAGSSMEKRPSILDTGSSVEKRSSQALAEQGGESLPEERRPNYLLVGNKVDLISKSDLDANDPSDNGIIYISAKNHLHTDTLKAKMVEAVLQGVVSTEDTIVTNARHYQSLKEVAHSLLEIRAGLDNKLPGDLLALDIRRCLQFLGEITGEITNEDQLDYIFSKFCIGK